MKCYSKLFLLLIDFILFYGECYAAPSDHGRILRDSSPFSILVGRILLIIFSIFLLGVFFESIFRSKSGNSNNSSNYLQSSEQKHQQSSQVLYSGIPDSMKCTQCKGTGYIHEYRKTDSYESYMIGCDSCKGFKHVLNDEALKLVNIYTQQITYGQQMKKRMDLDKEEKEKELEMQKNRAIRKLISEKKKVYTEKEYRERFREYLCEDVAIREKQKSLLLKAPTCKCKGSDKNCSLCFGSGHIYDAEMIKLKNELLELQRQRSILYNDYKNIYRDDRHGIRISADLFYFYLSNQTAEQIKQVVKDMPICPECFGAGKFKVENNEILSNGGYRVRFLRPCKFCKGTGIAL